MGHLKFWEPRGFWECPKGRTIPKNTIPSRHTWRSCFKVSYLSRKEKKGRDKWPKVWIIIVVAYLHTLFFFEKLNWAALLVKIPTKPSPLIGTNLHIFCWEPIRAHPIWTEKDSCIYLFIYNGKTIGSSGLRYHPFHRVFFSLLSTFQMLSQPCQGKTWSLLVIHYTKTKVYIISLKS
jgi:hypothetical protein